MKYRIASITLISLVALFLAACSPVRLREDSGAPEQKTATFSFTSAAAITITTTHTPRPTQTFTLTPTSTEIPTLTPTPTQALPVSEGTPFSKPASVISPENANQIRELARYGDPVTFSIQITRDGKRVIVSDSLGVWIYDREKQEQIGYIDVIPKPPLYISPYSTLFSNRDGTRLAILTLRDIRIIDDQNLLLGVFPYPENADKPFSHLTLSPDLSLAAFQTSENSSTIQVWDVLRNELVFESEGAVPMFLGDGEHLVEFLSIYEIGSWEKQEVSWDWYSHYNGVIASPDGKLLGIVADDQLAIWDVGDAKLVRVFADMKNIITERIAFSQNNQFIAVRRGSSTLEVWSIANGSRINSLDRQGGWPQGGWPMELLTIGNDGQVTIDEFAEKLVRSRGGMQTDMHFDADETGLLSTDVQSFIDGQNWWAMKFSACAYWFWEPAVCAESEHPLIYDSQGKMYSLVKQENGEYELHEAGDDQAPVLATLRGGNWIIRPGPVFSPDRRFLIYATYDGYPGSEATNVWNMMDDHRLQRWQARAEALVLSPDGRFLAQILAMQSGVSVSGNYLLVYDLEDKRVVYREDGTNLPDWSTKQPAAYSPGSN
jgi:hypothetical protein